MKNIFILLGFIAMNVMGAEMPLSKVVDLQSYQVTDSGNKVETTIVIREDDKRGVTCYIFQPTSFKYDKVEIGGSYKKTLFDGNNVGSISCVKTHKGTDPKYNEKP